jgi:hypothetical protein
VLVYHPLKFLGCSSVSLIQEVTPPTFDSSFCRAYMSRHAVHPLQRRKLANAAAVAFRLRRARVGAAARAGSAAASSGGRFVYRLDTDSVALLSGGFH